MQVQVQHLSKKFDNTDALTDVNFSVAEGEFVSIIGPSGAGKSTLFRVLNGVLQPDCGEVYISGQNLTKARGASKRGIQKRIGTIYQDFCLVEPVSCRQNVLNAALPDMHTLPAILGIFGKDIVRDAEYWLSRVGLEDKIDEPVKNLSGGQKQRAAIARALMRRPDILLADEPVASLDPVTGHQIMEILHELNRSDGITVIMNSHNLAFSMEFSSRLIGLHDGRIVFDGTSEELDDNTISLIYGNPEGMK